MNIVNTLRTESTAAYGETRLEPTIPADTVRRHEDATIERALEILRQRCRERVDPDQPLVRTPRLAALLFGATLCQLEHEAFAVMFLATDGRMIALDVMFHGTLDSASVYSREVVKAALAHNARSVILAHNHPSGSIEPSDADRRITTRLVQALELVGVDVLDHVIVSGADPEAHYSFNTNKESCLRA